MRYSSAVNYTTEKVISITANGKVRLRNVTISSEAPSVTVGNHSGTSRSRSIVNSQNALDSIDAQFNRVLVSAARDERAANQRDARRAKR